MSSAWMSARSGHAIVVTDSEHYLLEAGRQAPPQPCAPGQLNNLRALASDVVMMEADVFPFPEVQKTLNQVWREQSALDLLLMTLDRDLEESLRQEAARVASRLLARPEVYEAVRRRLLGTPLPEVADVEGAPAAQDVTDLVCEAVSNRELVAIANRAWNGAFGGSFGYEEQQALKEACIHQGGFAALICDLRTGQSLCFTQWLADVRESLSLPGMRVLLEDWQRMSGQLRDEMSAEVLCQSMGLAKQISDVFRASLKNVPLSELPRSALTWSRKAKIGLALHASRETGRVDPELHQGVLVEMLESH